jgi:hypothetical protein
VSRTEGWRDERRQLNINMLALINNTDHRCATVETLLYYQIIFNLTLVHLPNSPTGQIELAGTVNMEVPALQAMRLAGMEGT